MWLPVHYYKGGATSPAQGVLARVGRSGNNNHRDDLLLEGRYLSCAVKGRRGPSDRTEALVPGQHRPIAGIGIAPDNQAVNFTATHGNARQRAATLSGTRGMALISYSAAFRAYPLTKGQA
ncbi:hypothetical protein J6590_058724 [Homalodisca vitripennis]|nr:hypothetical protein J6590_058724 [Homalodisca vitripennis]